MKHDNEVPHSAAVSFSVLFRNSYSNCTWFETFPWSCANLSMLLTPEHLNSSIRKRSSEHITMHASKNTMLGYKRRDVASFKCSFPNLAASILGAN